MTRPALPLLAACTLLMSAPAAAKVAETSESGFTVSFAQSIGAPPDEVWAALVQPARWWSPQHSWSGNAANFALDPVAGGCFCERWGGNSAEHARVIFVVKGDTLRLRGAFGPLQKEALTGVLSFTLKAEGKGTALVVDYVVGGHARFALKDIAPAVDEVIGEQVKRLAALFQPAG
ncbi:MAG: SRPBCC domain-containing protein [Sphingobium sp.]|nr:SRPBCC domain-containing protein [Sphingobium sp.]